ncbi:PA14 domain-containing protein [Schlesneria paludicola]|uniref:c-type cytochrome n=1 Tax=Schlesneria paludicola TaxID=360056 RepID=UPI00029A111C|nr:c-type cytochrome [Schlesneria paludicola]
MNAQRFLIGLVGQAVSKRPSSAIQSGTAPTLSRQGVDNLLLTAFTVLVLAHALLVSQVVADEVDSGERRSPGLIVETTIGQATLRQTTGRMAHWISPEHPSSKSMTPWNASYHGQLEVSNPGTYRFSATVAGRFELSIDNRQVLAIDSGTSLVPVDRLGDPIELASGTVSMTARFSAIAERPAILRLFWQLPDGFEESIMPSSFSHQLADEREFTEIDRGTKLVIRSQCTSCHDPEMPPTEDRFRQARQTLPLNLVADGVPRQWLAQHLANPISHRHNSGMPRSFNDQNSSVIEIAAVTDFLKSLTHERNQPDSEVAETATLEITPDQQAAVQTRFAQRGCIACHWAPNETRSKSTENSPPAGSPDVDAVRSLELVPLDQLFAKYRPAGLRDYLTGSRSDAPSPQSARRHDPPLDFRQVDEQEIQDLVTYLMATKTGEATPPQTTISIPGDDDVRLRFRELVTTPAEIASFDGENSLQKRIRLGRHLVESRGCRNCHRSPHGPRESSTAPTLAAIGTTLDGKGPQKGCLSDSPAPRVPDFGFSRPDRDAIVRTLREWSGNRTADIVPLNQLETRLQQLGCTNCHERGARTSAFSLRIEAFGPLGRDKTLRDITPPSLDGIGEHLSPNWLRRVLLDHQRVRPWLDVVMPLYRHDDVESLIELLIRTDGVDPNAISETPIAGSDGERSAARFLVGRTGLNCLGCHDFGEHRASGVRAPDLTTTTQRIRFPWFRRWLHAPQALARGTRMPSIFSSGRSSAPSVLNGEEETQVRALWNYLSHRPQHDEPLLPISGDLKVTTGEHEAPTPTDRPLLEYGFLPAHAGLRGLAVGFPAKLNFAWNTETCQMTRVWQGNFVHHEGWTGSGKGGVEANALVILGKIVWRDDEDGQLRLSDADSEMIPSILPAPRFEESFVTRDSAGVIWSANYAGTRFRIEERVQPTPERGAVAFRHRIRLDRVPAGAAVWRRAMSGIRHDHSIDLPNDESQGWIRIQQISHDWLIRESQPGTFATGTTRIQQIRSGSSSEVWLRMIPSTEAMEQNFDLDFVRVERGAPVPSDRNDPGHQGTSR